MQSTYIDVFIIFGIDFSTWSFVVCAELNINNSQTISYFVTIAALLADMRI